MTATSAPALPSDLVEAFHGLRNSGPTPVPFGGDAVAYGYRIIGTDQWVFEVWEPLAGHATQRHIDGLEGWYGAYISRPLPIDLQPVAARLELMQAYKNAAVLMLRLARPDVAALVDAGYGRIIDGRLVIDLPR